MRLFLVGGIELLGPSCVIYVAMLSFLVWCVLFIACWPLALIVLVLYPIVWLLLLPFRIVGIAVEGVFELLWSIITLPARVLRRI